MQAIEQVKQLAEVMRQDIEVTSIEDKNIFEINLRNNKLISDNNYEGLIVPFFVEGRGGGNLFQRYVAIFQKLNPDNEFLSDMGGASNSHKNVALLAYGQIDGRRWKTVEWSKRSIHGNRLEVQACETEATGDHCPIDRRGKILLDFDGNTFGPNLVIQYYPP